MFSRRVNVCTYESPLQQTNSNTHIFCYSESMYSWVQSDDPDTYANTAPANTVAVDWEQPVTANQGRWRAPGTAISLSQGNGNAILDCPLGDFYTQDDASRLPITDVTPFDVLFVVKSTAALGTYPLLSRFDDAAGRGYYIVMNAGANTITCRWANGPTAAIDLTYPADFGTETHSFRIVYSGGNLASSFTAWFDGNELTATVNQDDGDGSWFNFETTGIGGPGLLAESATNPFRGYWYCFWDRGLFAVDPPIVGPADLGQEIMDRLQRYFEARYAISS